MPDTSTDGAGGPPAADPADVPTFLEVVSDLSLLDAPKALMFPPLFALTFWLMRRYGIDATWAWVLLWFSAVGTAFTLYNLRRVARSVYGASEVAIGMIGCGVSLSKAPNESSMVAAMGLAGSVYIIVRGIDNFVEGRKAERR